MLLFMGYSWSVKFACVVVFALLAVTPHATAEIPFLPATVISLGQPVYPTHGAAGDIDGNGSIDLVISCRDTKERMVVLRATPAGFAPPAFIDAGGQTDWVEIEDIDADGVVDLVATIRAGHGRLSVLRGLGGGAFAAPITVLAQRNPAGLVLRDFDGDGDSDAVVANYSSASLEVFRNVGGLSFAESQAIYMQQWSASVPYPFAIVAADLDGDKDLDLVTTSIGVSSIATFMNDGAGHFSSPRSWKAPLFGTEQTAISNLAATDFDLDGDIDIVTNGLLVQNPQATVIWENDGLGNFPVRTFRSGVPSGNAWTVETGDLDGDGDNDVMMGSALPGALTIAEVDPANGGQFVWTRTLTGNGFTRDITVVDLDGDADRDIVTVDIATHQVHIYRNAQGGVADSDPPTPPIWSPPYFVDSSAASEWLAQWSGVDGGVSGDIPPACGAGAGLCEEVHATPGCVRTLCCEAVCAFNPLCCEFEWDAACVDAEDQLCDEFNCPSSGACNEFHAGPGCDNEACCGFICEFDGFCCWAIWDEICAREAESLCTASACSIGHDPSAIVLDELCYQHIDDGCNQTPMAAIAAECSSRFESTCSTDAPRDTDWFDLSGLGCDAATLTIESEFPLVALLVKGACTGPLEVVQTLAVEPCASRSMPVSAAPATWLVISAGNLDRPLRSGEPCDLLDPDDPPPGPDDPPFVPGFFGLHYRIGFAPEPISGDLNHDGIVNGIDLTVMLSGWGAPGTADINSDGIVDGFDMTILLANWG